ncbi:hypothetical protein HOP61_21360 [Halomonas daqingensis]|uniref:Uncharacterized protein n=1 Tax=Billgrantia desiderata TaxID=52021 RepID=A0AAW4Z2M8_9GAMM|nr:hypothetical protein [Halomonas desiderata]MCE8053846.1 hypothetical protein [Halomonas desiderata]
MEKIYRVLVIFQKVNGEPGFLYGHGIEWDLTSLDYKKLKWTRLNITGNVEVGFRDYEKEEDFKKEISGGELVIDEEITLKIPNVISEEMLIEKDFTKEEEFNPFINLCSFATYLFYPEQDFQDVENTISQSKALGKIKKKFGVDLEKHPHLLFSFGLYYPVRIEERFKYYGKESSPNCSIQLHDYFNKYEGCDVKIIVEGDGVRHTEKFKLSNLKREFECGFSPDSVETIILRNDEKIYRSKSLLVKKIHITMNYQSGPDLMVGNKKIHRHSSTDIVIGDDE